MCGVYSVWVLGMILLVFVYKTASCSGWLCNLSDELCVSCVGLEH